MDFERCTPAPRHNHKICGDNSARSVRVVNPANSRLGELDVQVLSDGVWTTVYSQKGSPERDRDRRRVADRER